MKSSQSHRFEDIRPVREDEVKTTIDFLLNDYYFKKLIIALLPDVPWESFCESMYSCNTILDFQKKIVCPFLQDIMTKKRTILTNEGLDKIKDDEHHLFISNHRDIVLDGALLNILAIESGMNTTEIAIGNNLLIYPWIRELVRLNRTFIVKRDVQVREMFNVSKNLSEYIYLAINDYKTSVWIAQREGRAKNADDRTQHALIKMLMLSDTKKNGVDLLKALSIIPLSISYEYDPCDYLKAMEFQMKRDNAKYKKPVGFDLLNMETGILGYNGQIHYAFGDQINDRIESLRDYSSRSVLAAEVAGIIDDEIFRNYKIFPINYIAYDLLRSENRFVDMYTSQQKEEVIHYFEEQLNKIEVDNKDDSFLLNKLHEMYANPLINYLSVVDNPAK